VAQSVINRLAHRSQAQNSPTCVDAPLRNYSLTHSPLCRETHVIVIQRAGFEVCDFGFGSG